MTPASIIQQAQTDGVRFAISPAGAIKAAGPGTAVNRWLPTIRRHKSGILAVLREAANNTGMTAKEEQAIRAWLVHIEETDPAENQSVLDECRRDLEALTYFLGRSVEVNW